MGLDFERVATAILVAFGIAAPLPAMVAGMIVGVGCCYGMMIFTPPKDRLDLRSTLTVGFLICWVAAMAHHHLPFGANSLPLPLVMAGAGALSRWIGGSIATVAKNGMNQAGSIKIPFVNGKDD